MLGFCSIIRRQSKPWRCQNRLPGATLLSKTLHLKTLIITTMISHNRPLQLLSAAVSPPKALPSPWWMRTPSYKEENSFTTPPISLSPFLMLSRKYGTLLLGTASISYRSPSTPWNLPLNHLKKVRVNNFFPVQLTTQTEEA